MSAPRPLTHLVGMVTQRDWLTSAQLAAYAKFPSAEAARKYVRRHEAVTVLVSVPDPRESTFRPD